MNCYLFKSFKLCIRKLYRIIHLTKTGIQLKIALEKQSIGANSSRNTRELK
jgi:hypothetical protein